MAACELIRIQFYCGSLFVSCRCTVTDFSKSWTAVADRKRALLTNDWRVVKCTCRLDKSCSCGCTVVTGWVYGQCHSDDHNASVAWRFRVLQCFHSCLCLCPFISAEFLSTLTHKPHTYLRTCSLDLLLPCCREHKMYHPEINITINKCNN